MKTGVEYGARLQYIPQDQHFCGNGHYSVKVPEDGQPVALLVKKGLCSSAQKAEFASHNIYPPGIVKVLIIDGEMRIKDENDEYDIENAFTEHGDDYEDKDSPLSSYEFPSYYNWNNESSVTLRRRSADDISVALLHVSYNTGLELINTVINEDPDVQKRGGTFVTVDTVAPPMTRAVVIIWTSVSVVLILLACCCVAGCIEEMETQEPEPEPPRRPRRPRLTIDQVRQIPIGIFDGRQLVYNDIDNESEEDLCRQPADHSLDACTICLDDYEVGDKLRCLPCGHPFHANCIGKWLVERSATCPLCNISLYEEEEDEEEEDEDDIEQPQPEQTTTPETEIGSTEHAAPTESPRVPWWRNIFRRSEHREQVDEALTEPLLQQEQEEESEDARSDATSVQETQIPEQANVTESTAHEEETADDPSSI